MAVGVLALFVAGYLFRLKMQADAMRAQILEVHRTQLSEIATEYRTFRHRIEDLTLDAIRGGEPERVVDSRLRISGLRSGRGLYLRLRADLIEEREDIGEIARGMTGDAITRCMGISPLSARGLFESGHFLSEAWIEEVEQEDEVMRLRLLDDQLARNIRVETPVIASLLRSQWFMLVVQRGENRRDHPVDVFLWDLRGEEPELLMRSRFQGSGVLVPVRLRFEGIHNPTPPGRPSLTSGAAHDCSIAAQIKATTGDAPVSFGSDTSVLEQAQQAGEEGSGEGAGEGSSEGSGEGSGEGSSEEGAPEGENSENSPNSEESPEPPAE